MLFADYRENRRRQKASREGAFDSVECAEKAMRRRARQARAGQELVHAVSHQTAPAGPPPESAYPEEQS